MEFIILKNMVKKPLLILLTFVFIELLVISCCPSPITYYNQVTGIRATNTELYDEVEQGAAVTQSKFRIKFNIDKEIISHNSTPSILISNSYATSVDFPEFRPL